MSETARAHGSLDIVVANAGITQLGAIEEFSDDQIKTVLDINLASLIKTA